MPLHTTHPLTDPTGNYRDELLAFLNIEERFRDLPCRDVPGGVSLATIGYGFNIETDATNLPLVLNQMGILGNKTAAETQVILGQFITAATGLYSTDDALRNALNLVAQQYGVQEFTLNRTQATAIYHQILSGATIAVTSGSPLVIQGKEARLDSNLGHSLAHDTKEYVVLMSLFYNGESLVGAGSKLAKAVINGERAEAWYEIRYNSNRFKNDSDLTQGANGITNRRIAESNLFSLYNNAGQGVGEAEAKEALRMYTTHRPEILAYENKFSALFAQGGATIQFQLISAITTLVDIYGAGHTIDGEVLVGQDAVLPGDRLAGTTLNDLIFGEQGHDILKGEAGDDVLLGGDGTDQLTGGTGNDYLDGGAGYDTYIYRINDGQDTIRDADGKGSIFYDGKLVVGG